MESPEIVAAQHKWSTKFRKFNQRLQAIDAGFTMVGDSLAGTSNMQYVCLEEFANATKEKEESRFFGLTQLNPFLGKLHEKYTAVNMPFEEAEWTSWTSHNWVEAIKMSNFTKKFIVINTGVWFSHVREKINEKGSMDIVLQAYKLHFHKNSDLMQSVRSLIFDNITVIWRDTSPAGICEHKDHYLDHSLFIEYNDIARKALAEEGVLMLDIWNATLPYWDQHLEKKGDQLHYCLLQFESAQNIWIEKLMNLILKIVV